MRKLTRRMLTGAAAVTAAAGSLLVGAAGPADARPAPAAGRVFIVQGLPGTQVSVTVDGARTTRPLATSDIVGPLRLTPGRHQLTVQDKGDTWQMKTSVRVSTTGSVDVVLHRPASPSGRPVVTVYRSPLGPVGQDKGRLLLAHTATVPPADVRFDNKVAFANIANGEYVDADVPAGEHTAELVPTGRPGPALLGPLALKIPEQSLTSVYAVGRPQDGSMRVIVHRLPLQQRGSATPDEIRTGSAGLVAGTPVEGLSPSAAQPASRAATPAAAESTTDAALAFPALIWTGGVLLAAAVLAGAALLRAPARAIRPPGVAG